MKNIFLTTALAALLYAGEAAHADNWMSRLPDEAPLSALSIPGAHDSATGNGLSKILGLISGTQYAQTQELSLAEQWAIGVRAFDLRPCTQSGGYLNINHGIVPTTLRFDDALYLLRDSLEANPSEFAVIHLLHETDGDSGNYDYETLLHELMESDELADLFVDFRRDLTVGEMRGKILVLYRDSYSTAPVGGLMTGWAGYVSWSAQTGGKIKGAGSEINATASLYMQDFSDTSASGAVDEKVAAVETMLDYSTSHYAYNLRRNVWVMNFASAYSKTTSILGYEVSLADGYRDNATHTNAAIVDYLASHKAGPTGIILADYVGVDSTAGNDGETYITRGKELVDSLIANNFKYLTVPEASDTTDMSYLLGACDATDGTSGWTRSSGITANAGGQHWSDDTTDAYFEQSSSEWGSTAKWSETMTQTLEVPDGVYRLTAAGRSSSGARCTLSAGGEQYVFPAEGDTGGTIDIDGTEWESVSAGTEAGATFANNGAGRGWNWGSVEVVVRDGTLTISATLANVTGAAYQWASIDDFSLLRCGDAPYDSVNLPGEAALPSPTLTYDLTGKKVNPTHSGIYITSDGKKELIKK